MLVTEREQTTCLILSAGNESLLTLALLRNQEGS